MILPHRIETDLFFSEADFRQCLNYAKLGCIGITDAATIILAKSRFAFSINRFLRGPFNYGSAGKPSRTFDDPYIIIPGVNEFIRKSIRSVAFFSGHESGS